MTIVQAVRSNAIVLVNSHQTIALAGGFTNRVDAVTHAIQKASLSLSDCILASDAFFPFPDSLEIMAKAGIKQVVQPGGSVQDPQVIAAAQSLGIHMVFTGTRHFKH
jgi:phosphoribosylaminoimidazolecarboxamide formyltransferase/IMP cyclohydrolase